MTQAISDFKETVPVGELGIIPLESCRCLGQRVNDYIVSWRGERNSDHIGSLHFEGYQKDHYIIDAECARFVPAKAREPLKNLSAEKIFIF